MNFVSLATKCSPTKLLPNTDNMQKKLQQRQTAKQQQKADKHREANKAQYQYQKPQIGAAIQIQRWYRRKSLKRGIENHDSDSENSSDRIGNWIKASNKPTLLKLSKKVPIMAEEAKHVAKSEKGLIEEKMHLNTHNDHKDNDDKDDDEDDDEDDEDDGVPEEDMRNMMMATASKNMSALSEIAKGIARIDVCHHDEAHKPSHKDAHVAKTAP